MLPPSCVNIYLFKYLMSEEEGETREDFMQNCAQCLGYPYLIYNDVCSVCLYTYKTTISLFH